VPRVRSHIRSWEHCCFSCQFSYHKLRPPPSHLE
jgi:hypothetical protein